MEQQNFDYIKKDLDKMKETILNDYQYYDRRYDTVSMIFAGFGLYGCFEMLKWYLTVDYTYSYWLAIPIVLWLFILFMSLHNITKEKRIREYYMQQVISIPKPKGEELKTIRKENINLEDRLTNSRKWTFVLSIFGVVLMLGSLVCFLMGKL
jgi:hypothetical protein